MLGNKRRLGELLIANDFNGSVHRRDPPTICRWV
jgi:hypothetical protein